MYYIHVHVVICAPSFLLGILSSAVGMEDCSSTARVFHCLAAVDVPPFS